MAIKLPDPGNGIPEQKTGNDEWTNMKIVRDNFADQSNAASRLVGTASGNVPEITNYGVADTGLAATNMPETTVSTNMEDLFNALGNSAFVKLTSAGVADMPVTSWSIGLAMASGSDKAVFLISTDGSRAGYLTRASTGVVNSATFYTTKNTTKDTATGFLKASSPVLHVYNDSITKIHEANQLDITVDKKGVGHYEIHGTTGLRKNDGWFMSPPRDVHGNVLCMVDLEEKDGVVILKTYKKLFDFETVSIVHDYDNPMDIPDGVCVEFRFNDLPEEQLDEPVI